MKNVAATHWIFPNLEAGGDLAQLDCRIHREWDGVMAEVAEVPLEPRMSPEPMRSNDDVRVSQATYHSLGGFEIATWYRVPTRGTGHSPRSSISQGTRASRACAAIGERRASLP